MLNVFAKRMTMYLRSVLHPQLWCDCDAHPKGHFKKIITLLRHVPF